MTTQTTRRTLIRGAAWSAPVVAVAGSTPAVAASTDPCEPVPVTIDWQSARYTRVSASSGYYTIPLSDGTTITMQIKSTWSQMAPGGVASSDGGTADDNLRLSKFNIGGTGQPGLVLHQNNYRYPGSYGYQTTTFTFSRPVSTLTFAVSDIDASKGDFRDAVSLSTNLTGTPSSTLTTQAYNGSTWYVPKTYTLVDNALGAANVNVSGTDITSFSLKYSNFDTYWDLDGNGSYPDRDRDQRVFLTGFKITVPPTGC